MTFLWKLWISIYIFIWFFTFLFIYLFLLKTRYLWTPVFVVSKMMNCVLKNEFAFTVSSEWRQNYQHTGNEDHCGNLLWRGILHYSIYNFCVFLLKMNTNLIIIQIYFEFLGSKIASTFGVNWKRVQTLLTILVIWWSLWA